MTPVQLSNSIIRTIIFMVLGCLFLYLCWEIRTIFVYLAVSAVIALMGRPVVNVLHNRLKFPNWLGAIIALLLFYGILVGFISLFVSLVLDQPIKLNNITSLDDLKNAIESQLNFLSASLTSLDVSSISKYLDEWIDGLNVEQNISKWFGNSLSFFTSLIMDVFSVTFISFFFLKDSKIQQNMLRSILPDQYEEKFFNVWDEVKNLLSRYFIGLFFQVLIMFTLYLIILLSFGIDNAAVIAIICALFNLVPYLGPVLGGITISLLSLSALFAQNNYVLDHGVITGVVWIFILYLVAQLWDNFINQPLIYSRSVKSNPLEIFIVILIGGILFGVIGVIVAIPAYTALRVFLKEFYSEFKVVKSITKNI